MPTASDLWTEAVIATALHVRVETQVLTLSPMNQQGLIYALHFSEAQL